MTGIMERHEICLNPETQKLGAKTVKEENKRVAKIIGFANEGLFGQVFITDTHKQRTKDILDKTEITYQLFEIAKGVVTE